MAETDAAQAEQQEARAAARYIRMTAKKVRPVLDLIRGEDVEEALVTLRFTNKRAAEQVAKVITSAAANATHNFEMEEDALYVAEAYADEGPTMKRVKPRARGRRDIYNKRTCHITIVVRERPLEELEDEEV